MLTLDDVLALDAEHGFLSRVEPDEEGPADDGPGPAPEILARQRFGEIVAFLDARGRLPRHDLDPRCLEAAERRLGLRLATYRNDAHARSAVEAWDVRGILSPPPAPAMPRDLEELFATDPLGLLAEQDGDIYALRHVTRTRENPDWVAERTPCEGFDRFAHAFASCSADLLSGARVAVRFAGEAEIAAGDLFLLHGQTVYVAEREGYELRTARRHRDARLRCVVDNGTEYRPLARSLARSLYKDPNGRRVVPASVAATPAVPAFGGTVYALTSASADRAIASIRDLHKIGFTAGSVRWRIRNAESEATYLMAPVRVAGTFRLEGFSAAGFEALVHRFFGEVRFDAFLTDSRGVRYRPEEWFVVPLAAIGEAVARMADGSIVDHAYDPALRALVRRPQRETGRPDATVA